MVDGVCISSYHIILPKASIYARIYASIAQGYARGYRGSLCSALHLIFFSKKLLEIDFVYLARLNILPLATEEHKTYASHTRDCPIGRVEVYVR